MSTDSSDCPVQGAQRETGDEEDDNEGDKQMASVSVPVVVLVILVMFVLIIIIYFQVRALSFYPCLCFS